MRSGRGGGAYTSGDGVGLAASGEMLVGILRHWEVVLTLCHSVLDVVHGVKVRGFELCCAFAECVADESFGAQLTIELQDVRVDRLQITAPEGFSVINSIFWRSGDVENAVFACDVSLEVIEHLIIRKLEA